MGMEPHDSSDKPKQNPECPGCRELGRYIEKLEGELAKLKERMGELEKRVRREKRQAAPFSKGSRAKNPKRPGRKRGQGKFSFRSPPPESEIQGEKKVKLHCCPDCGGEVTDLQDHEQIQSDLPAIRPTHRRFRTQSGWCPRCSKRVRSRHPDQVSTAAGAAGVVIGPRAKALASDMKHRLGIPWGKIAELMLSSFHLRVTPSALCQADMRLAEKALPVYAELIHAISECCAVYADETGWRLNALSAWLWVFTSEKITVYAIDESRGHEVVLDILGKEFRGVLVSDCFVAYDHEDLKDWLKQKCFAHFLSELSEMQEGKQGRALEFPRALTPVLRRALDLRDRKDTLSPLEFTELLAAIESDLDELIDVSRRFTDDDNRRFAARLRKQRAHLFTFLTTDGVDATNNRAEQSVRYAVGIRKTGGCNKTRRGAGAHSVLASITVTARQRGIHPAQYLAAVLTAPVQPPSLLAFDHG